MTLTAPQRVESPSRSRRLWPPVLLAGVVVSLSVALHLRDPHESGSWGYCPWLLVTGTYCPGCGGLRAVNDLTRGDVMAAASSNLLFVSSIPLMAWLWLRSVGQRWRGVREPLPGRLIGVAGAVAVFLVLAFWVVRNLPAAAWLAP